MSLAQAFSQVAQYLGTLTAAGTNLSPYTNRNRLVNPTMSIDQANEGASLTLTSNAPFRFVADQWQVGFTQASAAGATTVQTVADSPTALPGGKSIKLTVGTGHAISATDDCLINQNIEAFNTTDLAWGTASASAISLSFWVKTSLTGATFSVSLMNAAYARAYVVNYTVATAATWTKISLPNIPGDTAGTWLTESNGAGIGVFFSFGAGPSTQIAAGSWQATYAYGSSATTNLMATSGATVQITGVQLEPGTVCTPLERHPIAAELAICQRYYCKTFPTGTVPANFNGTLCLEGSRSLQLINSATPPGWTYEPVANWSFPVEMRATPTVTLFNPVSGTAGQWSILTANARALGPTTRSVIIDNSGIGVTVANNTAVTQIFIAAVADARL